MRSVTPDDARRLLSAIDTAIIDSAASQLVYERTVAAMSLVCEALATTDDDEVGDTLLWVLSPAWESGDVDVPELLRGVEREVGGVAARGADEALRWLGVRT